MVLIIILLSILLVSIAWMIRQNREIRKLRIEKDEMSIHIKNIKNDMEDMRYAIVHDLSAPLRAVHGFCEIIQKQMKGLMSAEVNEFLSLIHENTSVMKSMIADVGEYYRVMNCSLQIELIDLNSLIEDCFELLIEKQEPDSVQLKMQPLPSVQGDRGLLFIMIAQLLSNAMKFSNGRKPSIINVMQDGEFILIQDNGVGFDMAYKDKIFKLFQRLHVKEQFKGNGTGLAIVNQIIQRHNGSISIESESGQGTCVYFQIPEFMKRT
ncbi:hypothetical protein HQ585_02750 [candidate division KSB1 bacterium]|nr:hypothetical protein [candidate division KSB1 bacterium]